MRMPLFSLLALIVAAALFAAFLAIGNEYLFFAGYVVVQYVVIATAWNILGGYCGYVNFGTGAFFAVGAYATVALHKLPNYSENNFPPVVAEMIAAIFPLPIPILILVGGLLSGIIGLLMGYLTLRLRGVFFAIATLALAVVLQTLVVNWDYVGGSRGATILRPQTTSLFGMDYIHYLFGLMLLLAAIGIIIARGIERSTFGYGLASIRDDELAAEAAGVPTLRLKLACTAISGALMGMAGAPFPYYVGYVEPNSTFSLIYAVNAIAMPMVGGTAGWLGPLLGSLTLGTLQQIASVTISSEASLLLIGVILVAFVVLAPRGMLGWFDRLRPRRRGMVAAGGGH
ncbi:branched-chain amino acid ABC transporter permease [Methylocella sp. CPCC 101449]|uniref:branched-chain amino acid ABC transporter permease n=1 Tax=Methylocella sp. CPCC 101449 TaxID=2987531 RepID=UPI0028925F6A|nr:branched-chain amino acid ABC transporter permease [Methylocella sp. CPCC 101449]MDT2024501.1 branched-chain amino acid ABC transporter permease [Methylocella sp. CPCC 101449]